MTHKAEQNIKLGVSFALIASFLYTVMNVIVKALSAEQSTTTIVFFRFAVGLLLLLPWFLTDKNLFKIDNKLKMLLRCLTSILVIVCMFYALKSMPVANVLLLNNTFPLFMPLLTWLMLGIKTSFKMWVAIILGFIGVGLTLDPRLNNFNWHALIALLSGFLAALALLQIRLLIHTSTIKQILFYLFAFGTLIAGIALPFSFHKLTLHQFVLLVLAGIVGAVYQLCVTLGLKFAKARIVSPIFFSCIVFASIFDWLIWSIHLSYVEIAGMVLIIVGGLLTILFAES